MWAFRVAIVGMILAMIGFVLYDSYASKKAKTGASAPETAASAPQDTSSPAAQDDRPPEIAPPPVEEQPWEARDDVELPEGHLSAGEVNPPGPEPTLTAPEAVPPPDPLTNEPPKHNPGGVNGDRPPREIPGMGPGEESDVPPVPALTE